MEGPIRPKEEQTNASGVEWKRHPQNQFLDGRRFALLPSRICTYLTSAVALCLSVDPNSTVRVACECEQEAWTLAKQTCQWRGRKKPSSKYKQRNSIVTCTFSRLVILRMATKQYLACPTDPCYFHPWYIKQCENECPILQMELVR